MTEGYSLVSPTLNTSQEHSVSDDTHNGESRESSGSVLDERIDTRNNPSDELLREEGTDEEHQATCSYSSANTGVRLM